MSNMKEILEKVIITIGYIVILFLIATYAFEIIRHTNYDKYVIIFILLCFSQWLLDGTIKIIKEIGNKRGWFDE